MKKSYPIIVVGHGRGGTSFANAWLNHNGIYTAHEHMGRHGIVESGYSVETYRGRGSNNMAMRRHEFIFDNKLCIVRNPWRVAATFFSVEPPEHVWDLAPHLGIVRDDVPEIAAIVRNVVRWTRAGIEYAGGEWLQAENWNEEAPAWLMARGFDDRNWQQVPENKINHQPGKRMTRAEIIDWCPAHIAGEVLEFAEEFGYE